MKFPGDPRNPWKRFLAPVLTVVAIALVGLLLVGGPADQALPAHSAAAQAGATEWKIWPVAEARASAPLARGPASPRARRRAVRRAAKRIATAPALRRARPKLKRAARRAIERQILRELRRLSKKGR